MNAQNSNLLFLFVMVAAFYLLIIRPQQKRAAAHRALMASLKPGDEIVSVGGVFGTIAETGARLRVRAVDGSEFELAPEAVARVVSEAGAVDTAQAEIEVGERTSE